MQEKTYNRIATGCLVVGVSAAFLYELGEEYTRIAIGAAIVISVVGAVLYFVYQLTSKDEKAAANPVELNAELSGPVEVDVRTMAMEGLVSAAYSTVLYSVGSKDRYAREFARLISTRLQEEEYVIEEMVQAELQRAKPSEIGRAALTAALLLHVWSFNREDLPEQVQRMKFTGEMERALDAKWSRTLSNKEFFTAARRAARPSTWEKRYRHKRSVTKGKEWLEVFAQEEMIGEKHRAKVAH